jgi:hypothetical protein
VAAWMIYDTLDKSMTVERQKQKYKQYDKNVLMFNTCSLIFIQPQSY